MASKSLWERLFPRKQPTEERPSHGRRLAELEERLDDIEAEVEKVGRAMRTWAGRMSKREAARAVEAVEGIPGGPGGDRAADGQLELQPADSVQHMSKHQVRQLFAAGKLRKLGA